MTQAPLVPHDLELVRSVLRQGHPHPRSDVDLALAGPLGALGAEAIAAELEDLPLPYRFDVHALAAITHAPLLEHIARVGMVIYPELQYHPAELP